MQNSPKADSPEFADTVPLVDAAHRNTSRERLAEEFGEERIIDLPDGTWELKLHGKREIHHFDEMDQERKRADVRRGERAAERDSATHVNIKGVNGQRIKVPERHAETAERIAHFKRTGKW